MNILEKQTIWTDSNVSFFMYKSISIMNGVTSYVILTTQGLQILAKAVCLPFALASKIFVALISKGV